MATKKEHVTFVRDIEIDIRKLNFQYIPSKYSEHLYFNGARPMSIDSSPHFRFLVDLRDGKDVFDSDYCKWLRFCGKDEDVVKLKVKSFISLLKSIDKKGLICSKKFHSIAILKIPFVQSRYNLSMPFENKWEIWHGHHRLTCCLFLGYKLIKCQLYKDSNPGICNSKFGESCGL